MGKTEATVAHPPVVSQNEWDAALTALLEREQTVAAAMHAVDARDQARDARQPPGA